MSEWERILNAHAASGTTEDPKSKAKTADDLKKERWNRYNNVKEQFNLHLLDVERVDDETSLPTLDACDVVPDELICITEANRRNKDTEKLYVTDETAATAAVHFYTWDVKFSHTWADPLSYVDDLKRFEAVISPDYSVYLTMPLYMQSWQLYRSRTVARIWQDAGLTVIPTLQWSTPDTYDLFFTGIPKNSVVSVSSVGCMDTSTGRQMFREGVEAACRMLEPSHVLIYCNTKNIALNTHDVPITWYENAQSIRFAEMRQKAKEGR